MTFLNDLWKKFKEPVVPEEKAAVKKEEQHHLKNKNEVSNAFQQTEIESLQMTKIINNLNILKGLIDQPKEEKPELRFTKIMNHLGVPECHETFRQERWQPNIHCPNCLSSNLKRLAQLPNKSPHNYRYHCLNCGYEFDDDSGSPIERGLPPLNIWMQCWYLLGCTDSLSYIASKLGLDLPTIEFMVRQLQKTFNAKQPLTRFLNYEEWSKQSKELRNHLKEDLLKQYERLNANIAGSPKDTSEFRRQQNLRRTLSTEPVPTSTTLSKKR